MLILFTFSNIVHFATFIHFFQKLCMFLFIYSNFKKNQLFQTLFIFLRKVIHIFYRKWRNKTGSAAVISTLTLKLQLSYQWLLVRLVLLAAVAIEVVGSTRHPCFFSWYFLCCLRMGRPVRALVSAKAQSFAARGRRTGALSGGPSPLGLSFP